MASHARSGRILAIDPGEKRIGVAAADLKVRVAVPLATIEAGSDPVETVARIVDEQRAEAVVVGLALSMRGGVGMQGQRAQELATGLARRLTVPVHTWDERLTSAEARRRRSPQRRSSRGKRSRPDIDASAAAIILQAYLDSRAGAASE